METHECPASEPSSVKTMGTGPHPKGEVLLDTIRPRLFQLQGSTYDGKYHELKKAYIGAISPTKPKQL